MTAVMVDPTDSPGYSHRTASEDAESMGESMASSSVASVGRSHRYKVAMTARARQRRMRRMKEKEHPGSNDQDVSNASPDSIGQKSLNEDADVLKSLDAPGSSSLNKSRSDSKTRSSSRKRFGSRSMSASKRRSDSRDRSASNGRSGSALRNRFGRDRSASKGRAGSRDRGSVHHDPSSSPRRQYHQSPTEPTLENHMNRDAAVAKRTKKKTPPNVIPFNKNEFIPDLKDGLTPDEVRDAANFTNIQFQCSNLSGEVEMLSGDDHSMESETSNRCFQNEVWSEATTPSILNKGEIFHHKAAASIVSLLTPDRMFQAGLMAPEGIDEDHCPPDVTGDSPTGVASPGVTFDENDPGLSRGGEWKGTKQVRKNLFESNNDSVAPDVFKALENKMIAPSQQMSDLLQQINRTDDIIIDRAYATRRKNACGAIKILSAKECNRLKICWTTGVLKAISSVLSDVDEKAFIKIAKSANTEARNRIVSTLLNLSVNKKNRMLICNTPGVLESMSKVISGDDGESRQGCCTALLYLAKTPETRAIIAKTPALLKALATVIEVPKPRPKSPAPKPYHNRYLDEFETARSPDDATMDSHISDDEGSSSDTSKTAQDESSHSSASSNGDSQDSQDSTVSIQNKVQEMEICFETPAKNRHEENCKTGKVEIDYDSDPNRFLHGARLSTFACLLCLVKNKENAFDMARDEYLVGALLDVSNKHSSPSHARAISIVAHLTRHPKNCHHMVFRHSSLLPMLQTTTGSPDDEARKYALCALQNLSMDKSCRTPIAHTQKMVWSLTERCKIAENSDELLAAVATLQNLSDEPANLIQFTIVKDCVSTIVGIAQGKNENQSEVAQFMAKNMLTTLSYWFRKIATSGSGRISRPAQNSPGAPQQLYNAVLQPTVYNQWS